MGCPHIDQTICAISNQHIYSRPDMGSIQFQNWNWLFKKKWIGIGIEKFWIGIEKFRNGIEVSYKNIKS